jgi:hypothetical protein
MSVPEMTFEIVGSGECPVTVGNPTFVCSVFLMHGFLMSLFMFLSLEGLLFACALVDTARVATGMFVLCNNDLTIDARLRYC